MIRLNDAPILSLSSIQSVQWTFSAMSSCLDILSSKMVQHACNASCRVIHNIPSSVPDPRIVSLLEQDCTGLSARVARLNPRWNEAWKSVLGLDVRNDFASHAHRFSVRVDRCGSAGHDAVARRPAMTKSCSIASRLRVGLFCAAGCNAYSTVRTEHVSPAASRSAMCGSEFLEDTCRHIEHTRPAQRPSPACHHSTSRIRILPAWAPAPSHLSPPPSWVGSAGRAEVLSDVVGSWLPARACVAAAMAAREEVHSSGQAHLQPKAVALGCEPNFNLTSGEVLRLDSGKIPWRSEQHLVHRSRLSWLCLSVGGPYELRSSSHPSTS